MGDIYVHGYVLGEERAWGAMRALHDAGFQAPAIDMRQQPDSPQGRLELERRHSVGRDTAVGALYGALPAAPIGAIAPGLVAQLELAPWVESLISTSTALATLEVTLVGAVLGAGIGLLRGMYRLRPKPGPNTRFFIGVHAKPEAADDAATTLIRKGGADVEVHDG